ncbi:unnamed protein product, partial [Cladocopium goreaui]
ASPASVQPEFHRHFDGSAKESPPADIGFGGKSPQFPPCRAAASAAQLEDPAAGEQRPE